MNSNNQQPLRKRASLIDHPSQPYMGDLPTQALPTQPLPQRQHLPNKSGIVPPSDDTVFKDKESLTFSSLHSRKKVSFLFRVVIFLALSSTIFLIMNQTQFQGHAATITDLLQNGDFETTGSSWLSPWTLLARNGAAATITQDSSNPASGSFDAHVTVTATSPNAWNVEVYQGRLPITLGQPITLTFFARASSPRTINVMLEKNYGFYNAYFNHAFKITTVWTQYTLTYTPTVSDSNTMFTFNLAQATGDVWLDNAVLDTRTSLTTTTPTPVLNIVQNSSFETAETNWLAPWTFNPKTGTSATISQDSSWATRGMYSAQVNTTTVTTNEWDIQLFQTVGITANQPYTISFSAKASVSRGISMTLAKSVSPWTQYIPLQTFNMTTTPQTYTVTVTPHTTDPKAWIMFNFGQATGQVWIDNIVLTPSGTTPTATTMQTTGPTPTNTTGMSAPPGYTTQVFDDQFQGTTLDTTKWNVQMGDAQYFPWSDNGKLPYPYSAVQNDNAQPLYNAEYGNPDQITVNNGLTLGAVRDNTTTHPGFADYRYTWKAGYVTTEHHFSFQGGYVQIKAQLPDSSSGEWAGFWFLNGGPELDLDESGYTGCGAPAVNRCMAMHVQTSGNSQVLVDTGVDLSAGYHIYGMKYIPGQSITMYLDGRQLYQTTTNIPTGAYEIIMTNTIASANTSGWHTLTSSSTPQPLDFKVAEVQVWQ
jgi:hypothetical protein